MLSTTLCLSFWTTSALKKQNGNYVINGNRIVNWSGIFKVGDVEVQYDRISNNIRETIEITGPTKEDITVKASFVMVSMKKFLFSLSKHIIRLKPCKVSFFVIYSSFLLGIYPDV